MQHRRPGLAIGVDAASDQEGQQREEIAVLLRHVVTDDARADFGHALLHACTRLHRALAIVEGIASGFHGDQARKPTLLTGIATKPGSASTRASQARTFG